MSERAISLVPVQVRSFRRALLNWYDQQRRDLPWRCDRDPYRIWVSEIMLQQTRVAAVLDRYARFLRRFPNVQTLARAREASVLAAWSGLGYYHRARRMHQAAKIVVQQRGGIFPRSAEEWLSLPGIGRYTAAAISSIAFEEPAAVVDGNVERVMQRLFGDWSGREAVWQRAESLLDRRRPGDFNQAMMELGATICTPRTPQCLICPVQRFCATRGAKASLPKPVRKLREVYYGLVGMHGAILLVQRPADSSLMAGMWELPELTPGMMNGDSPLLQVRHSITDTDYRVSVFAISEDPLLMLDTSARWVNRNQWERLALTGLTRKILSHPALESTGRFPISKG